MITRIVLAAGAGRRMGRTKALLAFDSDTALSLIARLEIRGVESESLVVTGHDADAVAAEALRLGLVPVHNADWERGQTGSLQQGLAAAAAASQGFLLHPVDLPLIRQSSYDRAIEAWLASGPSEKVIVATSHDMRRGHPLILARSYETKIGALGPDDPLRTLVQRHVADIVHVNVQDEWVRRDLDRPADYDAALGAWRGRAQG